MFRQHPGAGDLAQLVGCLSSIQLGVVLHTETWVQWCTSVILETGGSEVPGHPQLPNESAVNLGMIDYHKTNLHLNVLLTVC